MTHYNLPHPTGHTERGDAQRGEKYLAVSYAAAGLDAPTLYSPALDEVLPPIPEHSPIQATRALLENTHGATPAQAKKALDNHIKSALEREAIRELHLELKRQRDYVAGKHWAEMQNAAIGDLRETRVEALEGFVSALAMLDDVEDVFDVEALIASPNANIAAYHAMISALDLLSALGQVAHRAPGVLGSLLHYIDVATPAGPLLEDRQGIKLPSNEQGDVNESVCRARRNLEMTSTVAAGARVFSDNFRHTTVDSLLADIARGEEYPGLTLSVVTSRAELDRRRANLSAASKTERVDYIGASGHDSSWQRGE